MYISAGETHKTLASENIMKYIIEVVSEDNVVSVQEHDLSSEQVRFINDKLVAGHKVPLYATTKAKAKYGDCIIGYVKNIAYIAN